MYYKYDNDWEDNQLCVHAWVLEVGEHGTRVLYASVLLECRL
jgi:hypothetical protein